MAISEDIFFLDPNFKGSLQKQIQQAVASHILSGRFQKGERMPSSRALAKHLKISRITVTLAYQELVADGYLGSAQRSGYFVAETAPLLRLQVLAENPSEDHVDWDATLKRRYTGAKSVKKLLNWRDYTYPFIYGQADPTLFNHSNWRLCAHQALGKKEFDSLTTDYAQQDDPELINFIARQTLPRRGIKARPEQILVTVGAQNALWMVAQLLLDHTSTAVHENPGYPGIAEIIRLSGAKIVSVPVDENGLNPDNIPPKADVVFTTPSHQAPTAATMPMKRRHALLQRAHDDDFLVVEDDYEFEMSFLNPPSPALKSLDEDGRVIYVGSFSKSLFPGLRLGYLVGSEKFIEQARALRSTVLRHPPGHMQRTTAYFLANGHYDAMVRQMRETYYRRRKVMTRALNEHRLNIVGSANFGGSSFWMEAPDHVDTEVLAQQLLDDGVIIEAGAPFFMGDDGPQNYFRLAYSSINSSKIPKGVSIIAQTLKNRW